MSSTKLQKTSRLPVKTSLELIRLSLDRQASKCNRRAVKFTKRPVARWMKLGSDTRLDNGRRNF